MVRRNLLLLPLVPIALAGCAGPHIVNDLPAPVFGTMVERPVAPAPRPAPRPEVPLITRPRPASTPGLRGVTVVVDAGHGGKDPGAVGVGPVPEKVVNLAVARRLAGLLRARGANVVTTRDSDVFVTLDGRAATADRTGCSLFVSIHSDAARRGNASGSTVYIARNALPESRAAADSVAQALQRAGIPFRGVNSAGFRVLVGHSRPAMLIECGFLTHHQEARRLATPAYQDRIANAIADGITAHFAPLRRL